MNSHWSSTESWMATHTQTLQATVCHLFPLLSLSRGHGTDFSGKVIFRLTLMTSSPGHNTTVPLTTQWMTSLIRVENNCAWNTILCHKPTKGIETQFVGYHMALLCLSNFSPIAYQWPSWKDRTKDGSYPVISSAEVKEAQPSLAPHPATRVRDMWHCTHLTGYLSLTPTRYILSGNWLHVHVCVGVHPSGDDTDKSESDKQARSLLCRCPYKIKFFKS